jgi:hypothetical protein
MGLVPSTTTRDNFTDGHSAYNIATTSTHSMEVFSLILKQVHYNFVYIQLLLQTNPTGYVLEVQLLGDFLRNRRHLL